MLIVDVNALLTVDLEDFLNEVVVNGTCTANTQHVVGVQSTILQLAALLDDLAITDQQSGVRHGIGAGIAIVSSDDDVQQAALGSLLEADLTADLGDGGHLLGLTGLEQLLHSGKTLGDIAAGQTAGSAVSLDYVVGLLFDEDALITDYQLDSVDTTPFEARKHFANTWYSFARNIISDPTENAILYYMAD